MSIIHGEHVFLRPITADDFLLLVKWNQDEELNDLMGGDYPATVEECTLWHKEVSSDRHRQLFAIEAEGIGLIGDIELDHIAWRSGDAELRVRIGEPHWRGRGFGTEAIKLVLRHAFETLTLNRVYLRVFASNRRAITSYRKVGFRTEGALTRRIAGGEPREIVLMRILRDEFSERNVVPAQGIAL